MTGPGKTRFLEEFQVDPRLVGSREAPPHYLRFLPPAHLPGGPDFPPHFPPRRLGARAQRGIDAFAPAGTLTVLPGKQLVLTSWWDVRNDGTGPAEVGVRVTVWRAAAFSPDVRVIQVGPRAGQVNKPFQFGVPDVFVSMRAGTVTVPAGKTAESHPIEMVSPSALFAPSMEFTIKGQAMLDMQGGVFQGLSTFQQWNVDIELFDLSKNDIVDSFVFENPFLLKAATTNIQALRPPVLDVSTF